jgi:hypothetical protein
MSKQYSCNMQLILFLLCDLYVTQCFVMALTPFLITTKKQPHKQQQQQQQRQQKQQGATFDTTDTEQIT